MKDQNGNAAEPSTESFVPQFNHSYHPVAPGYSITARSLSTKFREELKYVPIRLIRKTLQFSFLIATFLFFIQIRNVESTGRSSPERPSSPVLVPGILKNNVAFFENLRNK